MQQGKMKEALSSAYSDGFSAYILRKKDLACRMSQSAATTSVGPLGERWIGQQGPDPTKDKIA